MVKTTKVVQDAVKRSRRASSMREREPGEVLEKIQAKNQELAKNSCGSTYDPEPEASATPNVTLYVTVGNGPEKATGVIKGYPDASR